MDNDEKRDTPKQILTDGYTVYISESGTIAVLEQNAALREEYSHLGGGALNAVLNNPEANRRLAIDLDQLKSDREAVHNAHPFTDE